MTIEYLIIVQSFSDFVRINSEFRQSSLLYCWRGLWRFPLIDRDGSILLCSLGSLLLGVVVCRDLVLCVVLVVSSLLSCGIVCK